MQVIPWYVIKVYEVLCGGNHDKVWQRNLLIVFMEQLIESVHRNNEITRC